MSANDRPSNQPVSELGLTRRQVVGGLASTTIAATLLTRPAHGVTSAANDKVRAVLESLVAEGPEIGLQVAAYVGGKLVIDAWAGKADAAARKPVDGDTLFMLSSTTKGVTSTCMHLCVEKHGID